MIQEQIIWHLENFFTYMNTLMQSLDFKPVKYTHQTRIEPTEHPNQMLARLYCQEYFLTIISLKKKKNPT